MSSLKHLYFIFLAFYTCCRLKKQVPSEILLMIYHSTILPHLNYCITAWGNCKSKAWTRLETLHEKAVCLACKVKFNSHCAPIYKSQKILSLSHLFELNCCKMYARYLKGILPQYFNEQLHPVSSTHSHFTRQQNDAHINRCRHPIQHQSFNHKVSKAWNQLPILYKPTPTLSLNSISRKLKQYFISLYSETCSIVNCYICRN
jgi:hypothetical protein